ncbi:MAG TPA: type II CAAX endopeptidase family protein [Acidimicrobiia bacterium]|nr:type II CAAX endopeptidase family protein [Acidimicrobiia bacterium]
MSRSWSIFDFALIWLSGFLVAGVFFAAGVAVGDEDLLVLFGLAGQYVGNLGAYWLLYRMKERPDVGFLIRGPDFVYVALGLVLQIAMAVLVFPLSNLLFPEGQPPQEFTDIVAQADTMLLGLALALALVVVTPVTEELMYRGVLLRALEPRGKRFALVVSSVVFSMVHVIGLDMERPWQAAAVVLPPLFILGLLLAWLTQRSGRLGPAILLHSGWNMLAVFVLLLPPEVVEQIG